MAPPAKPAGPARAGKRTSGVACASGSLPLRDQRRSRGHARLKPARLTGLLITSPSMNGFSASAAVPMRAWCLCGTRAGRSWTACNCNPVCNPRSLIAILLDMQQYGIRMAACA